jgi:hypothetical protein
MPLTLPRVLRLRPFCLIPPTNYGSQKLFASPKGSSSSSSSSRLVVITYISQATILRADRSEPAHTYMGYTFAFLGKAFKWLNVTGEMFNLDLEPLI